MDKLDELTLAPEPTSNRLNQRQLLDYRSHRQDCLTWLLTFGKKPSQAKGYALETIKGSSYRMDQFYRWVWDTEERYTTDVTHAHADEWMRELARQDSSNTHKANSQKAVKRLFKWRHHEHGLEEWTPEITFSTSSNASNPRDYLTLDERQKIRDAALEYGSIHESYSASHCAS